MCNMVSSQLTRQVKGMLSASDASFGIVKGKSFGDCVLGTHLIKDVVRQILSSSRQTIEAGMSSAG